MLRTSTGTPTPPSPRGTPPTTTATPVTSAPPRWSPATSPPATYGCPTGRRAPRGAPPPPPPRDVRLPDGSPHTIERFQSIGGMLGTSAGSHELHYLLENPWDGDGGLSDTFLGEVAQRTSFAAAPL